jgi:hypothetical protein
MTVIRGRHFGCNVCGRPTSDHSRVDSESRRLVARRPGNRGRMLLAIYLNDHLAGATVGRELARRSAHSNRGDPTYGPFLSELAQEIGADRQSLLAVMSRLGVRVDHLKVLAGWGGEKVGRLKLNGRLRGYSPLSRLVELEGLALGVHGKLSLWRTLDRLKVDVSDAALDLGDLQRRAEDQLERIEAHRVRAVDTALA